MATLARDAYSDVNGPDLDRWSFSWSAILAGIVTTLGLLALFYIFGIALGLTATDPYDIARNESSYALPVATMIWMAIAGVGSMFVGAWIAGFWGGWTDRYSSVMHGAITWSACAAVLACFFSSFFQGVPATVAARADQEDLRYAYSSLEDPQFSSFMLERARNWRPGMEEEPINVTAETKDRVDPDDVPDNDDLHKFVRENTRLNEEQAEDFLESEKNAIAVEQARAQERWEQRHAIELARADRLRKAASAAAWTLTVIAFLTLATAIGAAYLGWYGRDRGWWFERGEYTTAGPVGLMAGEPATARPQVEVPPPSEPPTTPGAPMPPPPAL